MAYFALTLTHGDGDRTLHLVVADSQDQIEARMAQDPWAKDGPAGDRLRQPWALWLDGRPRPTG